MKSLFDRRRLAPSTPAATPARASSPRPAPAPAPASIARAPAMPRPAGARFQAPPSLSMPLAASYVSGSPVQLRDRSGTLAGPPGGPDDEWVQSEDYVGWRSQAEDYLEAPYQQPNGSVVEGRRGFDEPELAGNVMQAEFALPPTHPLPTEGLTPAEVEAAITFNVGLGMSADEIGDLRDLFGSGPEVIDEGFVQAVARYQAQYGLPRTGKLDLATRRQVAREVLEEARTTGTFDADYGRTMPRTLEAFGLEQDDFGFNAAGRYVGSRTLKPTIIADIRAQLAAVAGREHVQENIDLLRSVEDTVSGVPLDLPFVLALGVRESGVGRLFSRARTDTNTAGRDTHPAGRSGMDYFFNQRRAFTDRGQRIREVTAGFRPGREDRRPAIIERRRLLLAFMVKTAQDERTLRRYVENELAALQPRPEHPDVDVDALFNGLSIDALRSWKALMFAGVGYGQDAVRTVLQGQRAAGEPFSLEAILTLDRAGRRVGAERLDRARAVALAALALEGDVRDFQ